MVRFAAPLQKLACVGEPLALTCKQHAQARTRELHIAITPSFVELCRLLDVLAHTFAALKHGAELRACGGLPSLTRLQVQSGGPGWSGVVVVGKAYSIAQFLTGGRLLLRTEFLELGGRKGTSTRRSTLRVAAAVPARPSGSPSEPSRRRL